LRPAQIRGARCVPGLGRAERSPERGAPSGRGRRERAETNGAAFRSCAFPVPSEGRSRRGRGEKYFSESQPRRLPFPGAARFGLPTPGLPARSEEGTPAHRFSVRATRGCAFPSSGRGVVFGLPLRRRPPNAGSDTRRAPRRSRPQPEVTAEGQRGPRSHLRLRAHQRRLRLGFPRRCAAISASPYPFIFGKVGEGARFSSLHINLIKSYLSTFFRDHLTWPLEFKQCFLRSQRQHINHRAIYTSLLSSKRSCPLSLHLPFRGRRAPFGFIGIMIVHLYIFGFSPPCSRLSVGLSASSGEAAAVPSGALPAAPGTQKKAAPAPAVPGRPGPVRPSPARLGPGDPGAQAAAPRGSLRFILYIYIYIYFRSKRVQTGE